jgi:hypothetical protein
MCPSIFTYFLVVIILLSSCTEGNNSTKVKNTQRKISSGLHSVIEELESKPEKKEQVLTFIDKSARINEQGEIQIYIQLYEIDESKLEDLKKHGVSIDIYDNRQKLVQGWASPHDIKIISELPFVKTIDLPAYGVSN